MIEQILKQYGIDASDDEITAFGSGLINSTWKISVYKTYILQKINTYVFKDPIAIADNLRLIDAYLKKNSPDYHFVAPLPTLDGNYIVNNKEGVFRLLPFVADSISINEVTQYKQSYEAAHQFGQFTCLLKDFDVSLLKYTLPRFHNLNLRYNQFLQANSNASQDRLQKAHEAITLVKKYDDIVSVYNLLIGGNKLPIRVIHHDAKINNVLFDKNWNGLCLVDLDTVMPGYFISDVGDMLRTYLSRANEEETDLSKIKIDEDNFHGICDGYFSAMGTDLTPVEKKYFIWSGKFMIYMQAVRFLSDYLDGDKYYHTTYDGQNLNRAMNQLTLLERLTECESNFKLYIDAGHEVNKIMSNK